MEKDVPSGTVVRAKATCLCCRTVLPPDRVRVQLSMQRGGADATFDSKGRRIGGARMLAVVTRRPGESGRGYRLATERDYNSVRKAQAEVVRILDEWVRRGKQNLCPVPNESLPRRNTLGLRVPNYGVKSWGNLFSQRQTRCSAPVVRSNLVRRSHSAPECQTSDAPKVSPRQPHRGLRHAARRARRLVQ
jgi:putative DNA methylase